MANGTDVSMFKPEKVYDAAADGEGDVFACGQQPSLTIWVKAETGVTDYEVDIKAAPENDALAWPVVATLKFSDDGSVAAPKWGQPATVPGRFAFVRASVTRVGGRVKVYIQT